MKLPLSFCCLLLYVLGSSCNTRPSGSAQPTTASDSTAAGAASTAGGDTLPSPYATKSVHNISKVLGWPQGKTPQAPSGFTVTKFADSLDSPRWVYVAPNGDILVAEVSNEKPNKAALEVITGKESLKKAAMGSANRITLFRDVNKDGTYKMRTTFLTGTNTPFGMLVLGNKFYVACTDGVLMYPYKTGDTKPTGTGKKILDLSANGRHWTRNIVANADGSKLYVSIGSGSDHAEDGVANEKDRALIIEINPDGSGRRVYASGLRNPVGMDWAADGKTLWTAVNERDELGDNLVPDYITSLKDGGFYGWPFSYYGNHVDPRVKKEEQRPDLVAKAIVPDVSVGNHTASLGFVFDKSKKFPAKYSGGAFIGQHGSWNRSAPNGYAVTFVPFKNGKPAGPMENFLTGFVASTDKLEVYGRPVGVAQAPDGSLLVADDGGGCVWKVSVQK